MERQTNVRNELKIRIIHKNVVRMTNSQIGPLIKHTRVFFGVLKDNHFINVYGRIQSIIK